MCFAWVMDCKHKHKALSYEFSAKNFSAKKRSAKIVHAVSWECPAILGML